MSDSVQYAMSVTPIEELTSAEGASGQTYDVLSSVTDKSLGGSNTLDLTGGIESSLGYNEGTVAYLEVTDSVAVLNSDSTERRLIFVKHTGYEFNSATVLGDSTTDKFTITMGAEIIAELGAGDCMILPNAGGGANNCKTSEMGLTGDASSSIACEFLAVTL